jgi:hypothetical protein
MILKNENFKISHKARFNEFLIILNLEALLLN